MYGSIKEIDAAELANWMENISEGLRVIDVREMAEMAHGIVPGAEPVPLATLPLRLDDFTSDEKLVLVCRSGARSAQACMFMQQRGFNQVFNLRGGMINWAGMRLPISALAGA